MTYQAILVAPDGDYVTDHEYETPDEVMEAINNQGSRWIFYPFAAVIKTVPHPRTADAVDSAVVVDICDIHHEPTGIYVSNDLWNYKKRTVLAFRNMVREIENERNDEWPGQCPQCGDIHDPEGEPDEHGNRFIPEQGICNNCQ